MRPVIFRCSPWMFWLLIAGALALLAVIPAVGKLALSGVVTWICLGLAVCMFVYALTLLTTKLEASKDGLRQKQLLWDLQVPWSEIAEWRYERGQDGEAFWIVDRRGNKHDLKKWLVYGKQRSKQLADVMREKGIAGSETDYSG